VPLSAWTPKAVDGKQALNIFVAAPGYFSYRYYTAASGKYLEVRPGQTYGIALVAAPTSKVTIRVLLPDGKLAFKAAVRLYSAEATPVSEVAADVADNGPLPKPIDPEMPDDPAPDSFTFDGQEYDVDLGTLFGERNTVVSNVPTPEHGGYSFNFAAEDEIASYKVIASVPGVGIGEVALTGAPQQTITLKPAGGITIAGVALGEDDKPAAGVKLRDDLSEQTFTTGADGRFEIPYSYPNLFSFSSDLKSSKNVPLPQIYTGNPKLGGAPFDNLRLSFNPPATMLSNRPRRLVRSEEDVIKPLVEGSFRDGKPTKGQSTRLTDFDEPEKTSGLLDGWNFTSAMKAALAITPDDPASGKALHLTSSATAAAYASISAETAAQLPNAEAFSFRLLRRADSKPLTLEFVAVEQNHRTRFWRNVLLPDKGSGRWETIVVPLRYMRWSQSDGPTWNKIRLLGFVMRDAGDIVVDDIRLQTGTALGAEMDVNEAIRLAFPGEKPENIRHWESPNLRVITNAPKFDYTRVMVKMDALQKDLKTDFPFLESPIAPPTVLVFKTERQYRRYAPRMARSLNAESEEPRSGGYTLHATATSAWSEKYGTERPVYYHEYVHAYMARAALLPIDGNWLQEGLAVNYQLKYFPQENFGDLVKSGMRVSSNRMSLQELTKYSPVPLAYYWQAKLVVEMLLQEPRYREKLPQLFAYFREKGSAQLEPALKDIYGISLEDFDKEWTQWVGRTYKLENVAPSPAPRQPPSQP
jgi:hypothetical protein